MTTTTLKVTIPGKGVPRRLLDELDKTLLAYYERTWGRDVWTMDIEVQENNHG